MFDADFTPVGLPRLIICGRIHPEEARPRFRLDLLPCYQALTAAGDAARSLPWIVLTSTNPVSPTSGAAAVPPLLSADERQVLAEALENTNWLLLVVGSSPESPALAAAIAADAMQQGTEVITLIPAAPTPAATNIDLLAAASALCHCPPTVSPLLAAEVLWASVMCQGIVGVDYGDLRDNLTGDVHLHFAPQRQDGPERVRALLSQLDDIEAPRTLWAVLVMPDDCSLEEFTEVGDYLHDYCGDDTAVVIALPSTNALPRGLYLFTC